MTRRLLIGVLAALAAAAPALGDVVEKKQSIDSRIAHLQDRVQSTKDREAALQHEIDSVSGEIRGLEQKVGVVSDRLAPLLHELELRELKLNRLNALFQVQTERVHFLRAQYRTALARFNLRMVAVYESDAPDELSFLLAPTASRTSSTGSTTCAWSSAAIARSSRRSRPRRRT